jgi:hypothetical protein
MSVLSPICSACDEEEKLRAILPVIVPMVKEGLINFVDTEVISTGTGAKVNAQIRAEDAASTEGRNRVNTWPFLRFWFRFRYVRPPNGADVPMRPDEIHEVPSNPQLALNFERTQAVVYIVPYVKWN